MYSISWLDRKGGLKFSLIFNHFKFKNIVFTYEELMTLMKHKKLIYSKGVSGVTRSVDKALIN